MINDCQVEAEMLRQRFKGLSHEGNRLQKDNARIWEELQKARAVGDSSHRPIHTRFVHIRIWTKKPYLVSISKIKYKH
jgi:hypothetical protein